MVLLLDRRFAERRYVDLFPRHWQHWQTGRSTRDLANALDTFWQAHAADTDK